MANWCSTRIWFYSENYDTIEDFHDFVNDSLSKDVTYRNSLKNILVSAGVDYEHLSYRGTVEYISDIDIKDGYHYFTVDTETAWVPMIRMWYEVLKSQNIDNEVGIAFEAEECGCELYAFYDQTGEFVVDMVYIDSYEESIHDYYASLHDANEALREFFKVPDASQEELDKLVEQYNEENSEGDDFIYVHVFEEVDFFEYE